MDASSQAITPPQDVDVTANGVKFRVLVRGQGPLILFLHGFPDTAHTWDHAASVMAANGFRTAAPFMRGYAPTQVPADGKYDPDTLGQDALELIPALGEQQAIVVGHDWGASAAYAAVGLNPSRVRFLVTVAIPHLAGVKPTPALAWAVRHFVSLRLPGAAARIRKGNLEYLEMLRRRWSPAWNIPPEEPRNIRNALGPPGHLEAALGYYLAAKPRLSKGESELVKVPAAAFAGEGDAVEVDVYRRCASRYTAGYEVVPMPGAHFMHREHPGIFAQHLLRLLSPLRG